MNLRCVIIDDEYLALRVLEGFCARIPGITLLGSFKDARQALSFIQNNPVDLLFLDIQMPHLSGVELASILKQSSAAAPKIVFTTARHEFAIQAFELEALDYLVKPIAFQRFEKTIHRATIQLASLEDSPTPSSHPDFFLIRSGHRSLKLHLPEIILIEGLNEYVKIHTNTQKIVTLAALRELETSLPSTRFIRIHRSYIVSIQHIRSWSTTSVEMTGGHRLPVGRVYKEQFLRQLNQSR